MAEQPKVTIDITRKTRVGENVYFAGTRVIPASDAKAIVDAGNGTVIKEKAKAEAPKENK